MSYFTCANTPEYERFDGLELSPVQEMLLDNGQSACERCEANEADFWSVYGHLRLGGAECLADFNTVSEAEAFAQSLLRAHPHLREFSLLKTA